MAAHVPSRLYRSRSQKMLAGVCGGLGEYFDVDPVLIRLLFVVTTFISGTGILAYIVLWIVVPFEGGDTSRMDTLKRDFGDLTGRVRDFMDPPRSDMPSAGPAGQGGPDVTGYHGGFGPYGPQGGTAPGPQPGAAAGPASSTSPFTTSREASMSSESTSARVPGTESTLRPETPPNAGASTGGTATGSTATADRPVTPPADDDLKAPGVSTGSTAPADDTPLEIDPPAGLPPGAPPHHGAGDSGPTAAGASRGPAGPGADAPFGQGPGTPPFGSSFGGPFGGPSGGPFGGPFSGPFGGATGGPAGGPYSGAAGGQGWSQTSGPESAGGAPFFGPPPTERRRRRQHWAGALLILIGLMILGNNLGLLWWIKMQYLMPLLLVGAGAWLLFGRGRRG